MAFNNFPYTNFQDLNLGWILNTYKNALNKALEALGKANAVEAEVGTYTDQINAATLTANQASATANQAMNIASNANEVLFISADAENKAVNYVTWSQGGSGYVTAADIYSAIVTDHKVPVFMDRSQYIYEMAGYETDPNSPLTITRFKFQKDGGNRQDILWIDGTGSITYTTVYRGAGTFVVNITNSQSTGSITSDKTYSEISSAYNSGMSVQCHVVDEVRNLEYYAYDCFFTENSETGDYFGWVSPYDYSNTRFYRAFVREDNIVGISILPISGGGSGVSIQDVIDTVNDGDTNALLYTAQTLSTAQQAQVKQNLGITGGGSSGMTQIPISSSGGVYSTTMTATELLDCLTSNGCFAVVNGVYYVPVGGSYSGPYGNIYMQSVDQSGNTKTDVSVLLLHMDNSSAPTITVTLYEKDVLLNGAVPYIPISASSSSIPALQPNTLVEYTGDATNLSITLATPSDNSISNEYHFIFHSGSTPTTLTIPNTVRQPDGFTVEANHVYEVSILNNNMTAQGWAVTT